jgi:S1-C subfamily serine protease
MSRTFSLKAFVSSFVAIAYFMVIASLGQTGEPAQPKSSIGLIGAGGYVVEAVEKRKGAEKAGLRIGTIILRVNEQDFLSLNEFKLRFKGDRETEIRLLHMNKGAYRSRTLKLQEVVSHQDLGVTGTLGYVVQKVIPNSPASEAGFQPGDTIIDVNGQPFSSLEEFGNLMVMREPGTQLALKVQRQDESGIHRYNLSIKSVPFSSIKRQ